MLNLQHALSQSPMHKPNALHFVKRKWRYTEMWFEHEKCSKILDNTAVKARFQLNWSKINAFEMVMVHSNEKRVI